MEDLRKRATELEIEVAILRKEKSAWNTFLEQNETSQRPEDLTRELNRERMAHRATVERVQGMDLELRELRTLYRSSTELQESLSTELKGIKERFIKTERRYERLERQRNLAQREVEFLKEQLRTYDSEETVFFNGGNVDKEKLARIEGLEKLVEECKVEIERLNKEGPIMGSGVENGKRKRVETIEDDDSRRKIRVLQNGKKPPLLDISVSLLSVFFVKCFFPFLSFLSPLF
jgi:mitotic spindle assembly checkpoint protein MAD1